MRVSNLDQLLGSDETEAVIKLGEQLMADGLDLRPAQATFVYVTEFEQELNNGGFQQYFYNSSGDHALACVTALNEVGAAEPAKLLTKAIEVFPKSFVPLDRDERVELIERMGEKAEERWEKLDDRYYSLGVDLAPALMKHVRENRGQFE